jgi:spermidine synthase
VRKLLPAAYALTFLTGFSGLVYQVVWQRYLTRLLGSDGPATATVLGVFLGGLSLGYLVCGKLTRRTGNLFALYGALEAAIGLWALAFPWLFRAVMSLTASWSFAPPAGLVLQGTAAAAILMGFPTLCMGATVPMLTRGLASTLEASTRVHARIYAVNAAGACVGALCAGFVLIVSLGLPGSLMLAAPVNLLAGLFFIVVGRRGTRPAAPVEAPGSAPGDDGPAGMRPPRPALYAIALLSGIYFMTLESLFIRVTNLAFGSSSHSFALIVTVFVLAVALGAYWVGRRRVISPSALLTNQILIGCGLMLLFLTLDKWPYAAHLLRIGFPDTGAGFVLFHGAALLALTLVLLGPVGCMGATLPLAFHLLRRDLGDVGRDAGTLFAWNALGNLFGGLVGGYLIYHLFRIGEVFLVALALAVAGAGLASLWLPARRRLAALALAAVAGLFNALFPMHSACVAHSSIPSRALRRSTASSTPAERSSAIATIRLGPSRSSRTRPLPRRCSRTSPGSRAR